MKKIFSTDKRKFNCSLQLDRCRWPKRQRCARRDDQHSINAVYKFSAIEASGGRPAQILHKSYNEQRSQMRNSPKASKQTLN